MGKKESTPVRILVTRVGELAKLVDSDKLDPGKLEWCKLVLANNPPGQRIYAEADMIEACESQAEQEVYREVI